MRSLVNSHINDIWNAGGPFIGDNGAPHGRVTVQEGWLLRASGTSGVVGSYKRGPVRWFQDQANDQIETEVPNIKSINIVRALSTDAAACTIVIQNQWMRVNGTEEIGDGDLGQPGYFTFNRGESADAQARWNQVTNPWNRILVPNALLRTYQGYGGKTLDIGDAINAGNIIQTGLWLIDNVQPNTNGDLTLTCRDMGKLTIDQSIYPPLVPANIYGVGLSYSRWVDDNHPVIPYGTTVYQSGYIGVNPVFDIASSDKEGPVIAGHKPGDSVDYGDVDTYWLSSGHATGTTSADMEFIQYTVPSGSTTIGGFNFFPYGGNYLIYVSLMVGGVWQGATTIPYTGTRYASGTYKAAIPYVQSFAALGWENPETRGLKVAVANVQKVRLTFSQLARTSVGPYYYRCGMRDFTIGQFAGTVTGGGRTILGIVEADTTSNDGYWLAGTDGGVFSFGSARYFGSEGGAKLNAAMVGMASHGDNTGYWMVGADGGVFAFGKSHFFGSLPLLGIVVSNVIAIERSEGGEGYYLTGADGGVFAFGDATYAGEGTSGTCVGMAVRPQGGYWLVNSTGGVFAYGGATYHGGSPTITHPITSIASTSTGNGYWLVGTDGAVFAYGDAVYQGGLTALTLNDPISDIEPYFDDSGYLLVGQDGGVFAFPTAQPGFWGSLPQSFDFETAGNYRDYSDIIKDLLLWSGWWLEVPAIGTGFPQIFGNIESTGAWALEPITPDYFDKKPVQDVITAIKEIVGYLAYVDDQGGYHFESANIWSVGNFYDTGEATSIIPNIDEALQITSYEVAYTDADANSSIEISSSDPIFSTADTITTTRQSIWGQALLKGIVKNALWIEGLFTSPAEQAIMAELIDLWLFFASRQGNITFAANPAINMNDQVRIWERQTSETYIHYVTAITSNMDLQTGEYTMVATTHWMGDGDALFIHYGATSDTDVFVPSPQLMAYLKTLPSRTLANVPEIRDFVDDDAPTIMPVMTNPAVSILYDCFTSGDFALFAMNSDGSNPLQLQAH